MLDNIGFYTLYDERARTASENTPLIRCEMILTNRCNFKCIYCRGLVNDARRDLAWKEIKDSLQYWFKDGLRNIRFSGGEPTLHPSLIDAVKLCHDNGVERIAISTNGSASLELYNELMLNGANDFSISLDACCSAGANTMAGKSINWDRLTNNIRELSSATYVTVGVVITGENIVAAVDIIEYAHQLGVADIRIIPAAQYTKRNQGELSTIPNDILVKHPILKYRIERALKGLPVRSVSEQDSNKCALVLDDSVIAGPFHYPCIIYLRERGSPVGKVGANMRHERKLWFESHDTHQDRICKDNCLDVCVDYNNRYREFHCKT